MGIEIKEINQLPQATALTGTELFELEQASLSVKDSLNNIAAYIELEVIDYLEGYFDFGSDELTILTDLVVNGNLTIGGSVSFSLPSYDTGWLRNEMGGAGVADWTDVHLGNDPTDPTDSLTHNLNAPLEELIIKIMFKDGSEIIHELITSVAEAGSNTQGFGIEQVNLNNILIQTATNGIRVCMNADLALRLNNQNWDYRIKIWKLG